MIDGRSFTSYRIFYVKGFDKTEIMSNFLYVKISIKTIEPIPGTIPGTISGMVTGSTRVYNHIENFNIKIRHNIVFVYLKNGKNLNQYNK